MSETQHDQSKVPWNVPEELAFLHRQLKRVEREHELRLELTHNEHQTELGIIRREHFLRLASVEAKLRDYAERSALDLKAVLYERDDYLVILKAQREENAQLRCVEYRRSMITA